MIITAKFVPSASGTTYHLGQIKKKKKGGGRKWHLIDCLPNPEYKPTGEQRSADYYCRGCCLCVYCQSSGHLHPCHPAKVTGNYVSRLTFVCCVPAYQ